MIAHMLTFAGKNCTAFLGGITKNYDTNYLPGDPAGSHAIVVVEADEYDRSFLTLSPDISVITSMDPDHLDIYGDKKYMEESYRLFASKLKSGGKLIFRDGLPLSDLKLDSKKYSITGRGDCNGTGIFIKDHRYHFDYVDNGHTIKDLYSDLPGLHNVENAIAAISVAGILGLNETMIRESLKSYTGVRRRFDIQFRSDRLVFIDDYAHHPEELRACISSVRELYPGKKILGIFQPHLFSRTRDFADGFAQSLGLLHEVILLDIYPARETPIPGVDSAMIGKKIKNIKSTLCTRDKVLELLELKEFDVLLTLGAGDIDQLVEPIRKRLSSTHFQSIEDDK
jgi:UDP-N-acetylmuramate--alanine ligase